MFTEGQDAGAERTGKLRENLSVGSRVNCAARDPPSRCRLQVPADLLSLQPAPDRQRVAQAGREASASVSLPGAQLICWILTFDFLLIG